MWPLALPLRRHRATIQSPPSPAPALPEVIIPAFLFLLFCKITPSALRVPFCLPEAPRLVPGGGVPWGGAACWGAGSPPRVGDALAVELLWGALGQHQDAGAEAERGW